MFKKSWASSIFSNDLRIPFSLALLQLAVQIVFHGNYGYFRDELYYVACSKHLAFGYVDQPPLSIAILWANRLLLGDSLQALRFLPSLAGAGVVLLAALMARQLGGGKFAQGLAALSVVAAHGLFGHGQFFTMNPFDVLFWTLAGYVVILLLTRDKPRLWILFGLVVGLGLLNKYSMGFMVIGLVAGLLFAEQRKQLATKGNAKVYYLSAIYPIFLAGGAVLFEQFVLQKSINWLKPVYASLLILVALAFLPFTLPVLPVEEFIKYEHFLGIMPRADERSGVGELP